MKCLIAVLLGLCAPLQATKPNIVFILADDLGYGDLSCYGQKDFKTPHLDALARDGLRFTNHYSGATVCAPSRACLLTGKDTGHAAIRGNGPFNLPESETTVATLLRRAGYRTAMIGKSCVTGNTQDSGIPGQHGFTDFQGTTCHKDAHFRYPEFIYENSVRVDLAGNHLHHGTVYDLDFYERRALSWLGNQSPDSAFFLLLSLPVPHASVLTREEKVNGSPVHYTRVADPADSYAKLVMRLDEMVGKVVDILDQTGLRNRTLVIFSSDNGPHAEGGYRPEMHQSSGPLRGFKRDLYEGGIRVPCVANWPGTIAAGRTSNHVSAFWDFLPTACGLAGIDPPAGIQGISYLPTLLGRGVQGVHESLYWESHENGGRRALRMGPWKLVQYALSMNPPGDYELYHLGDDLSESVNLADRHPEQLRLMISRIRQSRVANRAFPYPALDP